MTTLMLQRSTPVTHPLTVSLPEQSLRELATRYIFTGPNSVTGPELLLARLALQERMAAAEEQGLAAGDVVRTFLRPLFDHRMHCGCPACRERCLLCRHSAEPVAEPAPGQGAWV